MLNWNHALAKVGWADGQGDRGWTCLKQGSSENDGRSDVYDRLYLKVISNCC